MDGITAGQIRSAQLWETTERKNSALVQVLKQACSRNKTMEKRQMWEQKDREDKGNAVTVSLKSRDGEVRSTVTRVPRGADVTDNNVNKYAEDRAKLADKKEDCQLERFCDGNDSAWRPDTFFTDVCGGEEVPPWPIRPTELFTNPSIVMRIMAQQMEKKKQKKKEKKLQKGEKKKKKDEHKGAKKSKKEKKTKKKAKEKKAKKQKKEKDRKGKKRKRKDAAEKKKKAKQESSDASSSSSASENDETEVAASAAAADAATGEPVVDVEEQNDSAEEAGPQASSPSSSSSSANSDEPDWEE